MVYKAFKFRLYPNKNQMELINKTFGCTRLVYNKALWKWNEDYKNEVKSNKGTLNADLTAMKKVKDFLKEVDSIALHDSFLRFFKGQNKYPKFKKKYNSEQSYTTKMVNGNIAIVDNKVKLPKLGLIPYAHSRNVSGKIMSATIRRNASGKYYISILCDTEIKEVKKTNMEIGIDLGLTHFAITTNKDMQKIENPRFIKSMEKRLAREQKVLSRRALVAKMEGRSLSESKNYQKQKIKVAKIHEKIKNMRMDFLHKLSTKIVMENDLIAIEDLNVKGLTRNHKLAKAINDVSWGTFRSMLEYKCLWYGKELIVIDRFYPSSQVCSSCGVKDGKKALSVRTWTCSSCQVRHDRDINAANNILNQAKNMINNNRTVGTTGIA